MSEVLRRQGLSTHWQRANRFLEGIHTRWPKPLFVLSVAFFALLLFSHNPRMLLSAEFWGEDGPVWYAEAYDYGLASLSSPRGGYLNSIQRLIGLVSQPFPLHWAPTIYALVALIIQVLPAAFLATDRMAGIWPDRLSRWLFALLLVLMPNAPETSVNATNSQWNLAILAFLLIVSRPARTAGLRVLENTVLVVAGLSGPFGILFAPAAALQVVQRPREEMRARLVRLLIVLLTGLVQGLLIVGLSSEGRVSGPLGATPELFFKILALAPLGATVGYEGVASLIGHGFFATVVPTLCVLSVVLPLMLYAFLSGPPAYRQYVFFAVVMLGLALAKPLISASHPQWPLFFYLPSGNRYFLFPMLAWWAGLAVLLARGVLWTRIVAAVLLACTVLYAIPRDWGEHFHFAQTDFVQRAKAFERAPLGVRAVFMTHPTGMQFRLTKQGERFERVMGGARDALQSKQSVTGFCALNGIDGSLSSGVLAMRDRGTVNFRGWALLSEVGKKPRRSLVLRNQADGTLYTARAMVTEPRVDVAKALGRNQMDADTAGFQVGAATDEVEPGRYQVLVDMSEGRENELCDTQRTVLVEAGAWRRITQ